MVLEVREMATFRAMVVLGVLLAIAIGSVIIEGMRDYMFLKKSKISLGNEDPKKHIF